MTAPRVGVFVVNGPDGKARTALESNVDPHDAIYLLSEGIQICLAQIKQGKSRIIPATNFPGPGEN